MNILIVSTLGYTQEAFLIPYINVLHNEFRANVYSLANWDYNWNKIPHFVNKIHISFSRNIFSIKNYFFIFKLIKILKNNNFYLIYTHTPIASMLVRIANRFNDKNDSIVLYEAHGFHFHQYQSRFKNFIFKNIEKILSFYTDGIITINKDDFYMSKSFFKKPDIFYVPGIGIDMSFFNYKNFDSFSIKKQMGFKENDKIILTIADFIKRKNLEILIDIGLLLKEKNKNWKWIIIGDGPLFAKINKLVNENGMEDFFILTGYQSDVRKYLSIANVFVLLSVQEGLPRSLLEAGAFKVPAVVSNIRGNRDLIEHNKNSYLVPPDNMLKAVDYIDLLLQNKDLQNVFGDKLYNKIKKKFSLDVVLEKHIEIFRRFLK